ncbi:SH3 domain-containing protein C23A1,17 [Schizosaccharomyces pombe 972h-] [Rhizoctonia solani]|uniref:SH3 domain-containing protein C23A1,17 [Schizosaccharomyces pombe 972h-] n=1 Tax=Rhizoctonia solani TaxID=456999 RepID=A0A0K6G8L4_9AGAM|nr:SH3 domain-containing protein C23A1,17 [Schizosaccharomyces pombe 972h-] [Rhizoctonia solani]
MDSRKPSSLELPRARSATVGSASSGKSSKSAEELGNKAGASTKSSITSSFKSFASNLIRSKPTPAPAVTQIAPASPPRPVTPPPVQGPGPHTVRLIPSPGPNQLPWSRSAADLLEGVPVPAPAFKKVANELAEAERILDDEDNDNQSVSFGFGAAGYEDEGEDGEAQDITMASISLPPTIEQGKENRPEAPPENPGSFVFGSPQHSVTNAQFGDAAAAVLREMNARMGVGNTSHALSLQQLEDVMSNAGKPSGPIKTEKRSDIRFATNHDKDFAKMDSIANHYSVRSRKRKSEHTPDLGDTTTESKLFTLPPRLSTAGSGDDCERTTKRARISTVEDKATAGGKAAKDTPAVRAQLEKQRQNGRASGSAVARKSAGTTQQPAKGGFGLMKMVRGIWGSKEKEKEKEKEKPKELPEEQPKEQPEEKENPVSDMIKKFPTVPTEDPLPNLPAAPKSRIVSGSKPPVRPRKVIPKAGSEGPEPARSYPIAPKPRVASGIIAPTAASLARQATTSTSATRSSAATGRSRGLAAVTAPAKPVITKTTLLSSVKLPSPPATEPTTSGLSRSTTGTTKATTSTRAPSRPASRALPVPPTSVSRAATSGAAAQGSARMVSPPVRSATTAGRVTSPVNGRKSVVSPGSKSPRSSIFKQPLTKDGMSMRGSAPTVQPFRLNNAPTQPLQIVKRNTISSPTKPPAAPRSPPPATRPVRKPRISRSKVIAKLGEKRAAVGSPRASKPRSSIQGRSLGKPGPGPGIDMAKARMRKSEAASRRSRVVDKSVVGRRSEGAVLRR